MSDGAAGSGYDYQVCDHCRYRKIRCGREKPSCANCNRIGQTCEWSGQGKKGNQVAQLSNTVLGLESRIHKLEKQLENQRSLKRLSTESSQPTSVSEEPISRGELHVSVPTPSSTFPGPVHALEPLLKRPSGRFLANHGEAGASRASYFGPTSLETGMLDFKDFLGDMCHQDQDNATRATCTRTSSASIDKSIDAFVKDGQCESIKTGPMSPPTGPPLAILDAMMESYFATVNPRFPIWCKSSFTRMVSAFQNSLVPEQEWVSIVCCNNLILMTLTANSMRRAQQRSSSSAANNPSGSSIDFDLVTGFLTNAKRAIGNVHLLLAPRLDHVQALLSLCVIAQEFLPINVLEAVFALTVQCAKASGLYQRRSFESQLSQDERQEFQNVTHCLYVLEKEVGWVSGSYPNTLPTSENMQGLDSCSNLQHLVLRAELSAIEESVYLGAYTGTCPSSPNLYRAQAKVHNTKSSMIERLDSWLLRCNLNLAEVETKPEGNPAQAELAARYFCVKLLIIWPFRVQGEGISTECVQIARRCMTHLLRMWSSVLELGHNMAVPSTISSYPPLYLYAIAMVILEGRGHATDKDLLRSFANMIDAVAGCREERAFRTRLREMTRILVDAVDTMDKPRKRRKTIGQPGTTCSAPARRPSQDPLSPQSYIHASPAPPPATNSFKNSQPVGGRGNSEMPGAVSLGTCTSGWGQAGGHEDFDGSGFDGLVLQHWDDDPFTFVSAGTTGSSADVGISPDSTAVGFAHMVENWLVSSNPGPEGKTVEEL